VKCTLCHGAHGNLLPIGPKARFLNPNQLKNWEKMGILSGLPDDAGSIPTVPAWNQPESGSLAARARGYLEINCAHCHNPGGWARNTGLFLNPEQDPNSTAAGICKPPVAAGAGSGGLAFDIVPGKPKKSILLYRMHAESLAARMPIIGRSVEHAEGTELIRDWIQSMPKSNCK
jgi:uncharacterized repeat protein (TIGR03806 family)